MSGGPFRRIRFSRQPGKRSNGFNGVDRNSQEFGRPVSGIDQMGLGAHGENRRRIDRDVHIFFKGGECALDGHFHAADHGIATGTHRKRPHHANMTRIDGVDRVVRFSGVDKQKVTIGAFDIGDHAGRGIAAGG